MKIAIIGLSNIGDAVLMSPVIAQAKRRWPDAELTLLIGERAHPLFAADPRLARVETIDDFDGALGKLRLVRWLWRLKPDLLVDLRGTMLPLCWRPWRAWRAFRPLPRAAQHMRRRHQLRAARQLGLSSAEGFGAAPRAEDSPPVWISDRDRQAVDHLLSRWGVPPGKRLVVMSPGARSHIKRWPAASFARVADRLIDEQEAEIIFIGAPDEAGVIDEVLAAMRHRAHSAVGSTTLPQTAALLGRAALVVTNDSAALHLACAAGAPVVALFGPTDPAKYGPTGPRDRVLRRALFCSPCEQALCRFNHECMRFLTADEVYAAAQSVLENSAAAHPREHGSERI